MVSIRSARTFGNRLLTIIVMSADILGIEMLLRFRTRSSARVVHSKRDRTLPCGHPPPVSTMMVASPIIVDLIIFFIHCRSFGVTPFLRNASII